MVYWTFMLGLLTVYATVDINPMLIMIALVILGFCVLAYRDLKTALGAVEGMVCYESTTAEPHGAESGPEIL